jgi:uncharacterized protein (TIGR03067 family)
MTKRLRWLGLALVALLVVSPLRAADTEKDAKEAKLDPAKLVGTWTYVSSEKNGEKVDAERLKGQTVILTKETLTLKSDEATFVMKYVLGLDKTPVTISLTMTESPFGAGATAEGILELNGDDLKICYSPTGGEAPKKFEAKEGDVRLLVLKRKPAETKA